MWRVYPANRRFTVVEGERFVVLCFTSIDICKWQEFLLLTLEFVSFYLFDYGVGLIVWEKRQWSLCALYYDVICY
ncbi:hypothetical protein L1887_03929 [Cichorium endivia]|nr:hypothetical protein L1887_03929 [Cichorium endivia]